MPWEEVWAASLALDEVQRVEAITKAQGDLNAAYRVAYALNAPNELKQDEQAIRRRFRLARESAVLDPEQEQSVHARLRKAERIARRMRKGR